MVDFLAKEAFPEDIQSNLSSLPGKSNHDTLLLGVHLFLPTGFATQISWIFFRHDWALFGCKAIGLQLPDVGRPRKLVDQTIMVLLCHIPGTYALHRPKNKLPIT